MDMDYQSVEMERRMRFAHPAFEQELLYSKRVS